MNETVFSGYVLLTSLISFFSLNEMESYIQNFGFQGGGGEGGEVIFKIQIFPKKLYADILV